MLVILEVLFCDRERGIARAWSTFCNSTNLSILYHIMTCIIPKVSCARGTLNVTLKEQSSSGVTYILLFEFCSRAQTSDALVHKRYGDKYIYTLNSLLVLRACMTYA